MPKSVSELIEKPKILIKAKVPMSETGMVMAGMRVARQSCKNRKMTSTTMMMASSRVERTSLTDSLMTVVVSTAMVYLRPGGKDFSSSLRTARQRLSTSSALAFESCCTPMPTALRPENFSSVS